MDTEKRQSAGFFVMYFMVLLFALAWGNMPHVKEHAGGAVRPFYVLVGCALLYVAIRACLVLGVGVSERWESVWLGADLLIVTGAVWLTGGIRSEAALMYFWPITTSSVQRRPSRTALVGVASAALYSVAVVGAQPLDAFDWGRLATYVFVVLVATSIAAWYARSQAALVQENLALRERVALSDYRSELSREMHDGIQHYLVGIATRLELAKLELEEDPTKAAEMAIAERVTARQANDELRYLVRRLQAPALVERGFVDALRDHVAMFSERASVSTRIEMDGEAVTLPPEIEHAAFRIVQEALTNIEKYAEATEVTIRLAYSPDRFECVVRDDGVGFDASPGADEAQESQKAVLPGGFGLKSMEHRAMAVGGEFGISSTPGEGTQVSFAVPLHMSAKHEAGR